MITEEKQLLLKDLCARLPYNFVYCYCNAPLANGKPIILTPVVISNLMNATDDLIIKPYLRPMSSMTEEEEREAAKLGICYDGAFHNDIYDVGTSMEEAFLAISWLLERHFDINYLIEKGLAIEAEPEMYKI